MNEFGALVLGSALAVVGGILGTLFTYWLSRKNEIRKEKLNAYLCLLKFCKRLEYIDSKNTKDVTYDYLTEVSSKTLLYASDEIIKEHKKIYSIAKELLNASNENNKDEVKRLSIKLSSHIEVISAQMKKELKLENSRSKEILSLTIEKKDKENKNGD